MRLRAVLGNVGCASIYSLVFLWCYDRFLYFNFEYMGFDLFARDTMFLGLSVCITLAPVFAYRGVLAVSSVIAVLVYLLLYVPIVLTFAMGSARPLDEIVVVQLTFMASMTVLFLADAVLVKNPLKAELGLDLMPIVLAATVLSTLYMLFLYRGNLHFPSFGDDLYDQRDANASLGAGLLARYLSSWLFTVLVPLCLAYGLSAKRHGYTTIGILACLILYMAAAAKVMILLPFIYVAFYYLFRVRLPLIFPILTIVLSLLIATLVAVSGIGPISFLTAAIVLMRTVGNGGHLTMAYYDFFAFYERTGYSHVHVLNLFTKPYPYGDLALGQVIGQYFWSPTSYANANFWATDGIAAMGLPGVLVISLVASLLLVALNSVTRRFDRVFVVLCVLSLATTLLNASLFSTLWSGGAFFLILYFFVERKEGELSPDRGTR